VTNSDLVWLVLVPLHSRANFKLSVLGTVRVPYCACGATAWGETLGEIATQFRDQGIGGALEHQYFGQRRSMQKAEIRPTSGDPKISHGGPVATILGDMGRSPTACTSISSTPWTFLPPQYAGELGLVMEGGPFGDLCPLLCYGTVPYKYRT